MNGQFCHSCGMPLESGGKYCQYCTDENGNLYPKEVIVKGVSEFLTSWAPETDGIDFVKRAEKYVSAMPAWAEN